MFSVHALCRHLVARGHEVHVCTTNMDGPGELDVPLTRPLARDGVQVWYFRASRPRRFAFSAGMRTWLGEWVPRFDLVHTHSVFLWPPWRAARVARVARVPYVVAPRGMLVPELIERRSRVAKTLWLQLLERPNLAAADALHFTSERERDDAVRLGIGFRRAAVIANGVEPEDDPEARLGHGEPQAEPFLLYLGRINWKKGLDVLVRAAARAPGVRVVIAGNDEDGGRARLRRLAAECGAENRVGFLEPVYGAAKWRLLRAARALVLPSRSENFGNAVLEAMAVGRPVVVSPGVGLAAAVREADCGVVVEPEPEALAAALLELWGNASRREHMGARGRALALRDFTWPRIAGQVENLYRSILEPRAPGASGA